MQDFVAAEAVVAAVDCVVAEAVVAAVDCVAAEAVVAAVDLFENNRCDKFCCWMIYKK